MRPEDRTAKMAPFQLEEILEKAGLVRPAVRRTSRIVSIALALAAPTVLVLACAAIFNP